MARVLKGSLPRDAEELAGALAELGCRSLRLDGRELAVRRTDLPGLLRGAEDGAKLECASPPLTVTLGADSWLFVTSDDAVAAKLAALGQ